MARRLWTVVIDDFDRLWRDDNIDGKFNVLEKDIDTVSIYLTEARAIAGAKRLAQKYPGKEVYVLKQSNGFFSQPTEPQYKEWTADGQYVPATSK